MNESKLAKFDPRPKLIMAITVSLLCFLSDNIWFLLSLLGIIFLTLIIGGVSLVKILIRIRVMFIMILSLFIIQSLFYRSGGDSIISIEGILFAAVLSLRLLLLVISAQVLLEGDIRDYMLALTQMHVHYEIVFVVMSALHFIPILRNEAMNVYYSVQLRGTEFKNVGLKKKYFTYKSICFPILISALRRAEETSVAMELRGLKSSPKRTNMRKLSMKGKDIVFSIISPIILISIFLFFKYI